MKTTFAQSKWSRALVVIVVVVFLSWWRPVVIERPISFISETIFSPFQRIFSFFGFEVRETFSFFGDIRRLKQENIYLQKEHIRLLSEMAQLRDIRKENDTLRTEIGLLPRTKFELESAEVIAFDATSAGHFLTIDKGESSGIKNGMAVVVHDGVLLGKVDSVFPYSARVMLLTHPESTVAAQIAETNVRGVIRGEHGLGILFDMVLQTEELKKGDTVITSGLGNDFPRGLLIGTLQEKHLTPDRLFQQGNVISPVRAGDVRIVSVIKREL